MRIVFRQYPLPMHQYAQLAAEASAEANAQGKFWQYHDLLFGNQQQLDREHLEQFAQQVGLDMNRFRRSLDSHSHQAAIRADMQAFDATGEGGTPTFFINGRVLQGAQPFEQFKAAIDRALATR